MISFKGSHYPKHVILYAVYFYVRYAVSYRDPAEAVSVGCDAAYQRPLVAPHSDGVPRPA